MYPVPVLKLLEQIDRVRYFPLELVGTAGPELTTCHLVVRTIFMNWIPDLHVAIGLTCTVYLDLGTQRTITDCTAVL